MQSSGKATDGLMPKKITLSEKRLKGAPVLTTFLQAFPQIQQGLPAEAETSITINQCFMLRLRPGTDTDIPSALLVQFSTANSMRPRNSRTDRIIKTIP